MKIVHISEKYDIYIGRGCCPKTGKLSKYGNPFSSKDNSIAKYKVASKKDAILLYEQYLLNNVELFNSLYELKYKTVGCWCKSKQCHGYILKKYVDKLENDDERKSLLNS